MDSTNPAAHRTSPALAPVWPAVFSMSLGVFGLVGAEFLPASLLTPMATDLAVTEGMAGQAVTATAVVGLLASLSIASLSRSFDRRSVLLFFSALLVLSNLVVASAPSLMFLLLGRVLLGFALGGFWALSTATVMRLVPEETVPKALSIVVSGVSAATIFAAPVGSFLGDLWGWRFVFVGAAGLGILAFVVQFATLPSMPPRERASAGRLIALISRRRIALAMIAILLVFTGHMSLFTYIRPFLEGITGVGVAGVSSTLLAFGIANFAGNYLGGVLIARSLRLTLAITPLVIGTIAVLLAGLGGAFVVDAMMVALWGLAFGTVPVAWSAWIAHSAADDAENAGGLLVAAINLAIATGAAVGGLVLDVSGIETVFLASGMVLFLAAATILGGVDTSRAVPKPA